jgi:Ca2+:H+ antiporter
LVGNAAENSTAVVMATRDKMNLSVNIVVESSKQIALFVAPLLVLLSLVAAPAPMTVEFSHREVAGMAVGFGAVTLVALDGESNWLEGAMLLAVYAMLAVAFYFTLP